jgi:fructosamine-3-kinase
MIWQEIDTHISDITNQNFHSLKHLSVSGGCINQSYTISDHKKTYFVKLNQASQVGMFEAEILGLQQIYNTNTIRVPQPLCWGTTDNSSYIVLEWLEMTGANSKSWTEMGRKLAAMHKVTSQKGFGWDINNTIGSTPQINNWESEWIEFYAQHRLGYQFQLARRRGGNFPLENKLLAAISELLANHLVQPSLVHGDLWGGNAGSTINGEPVIFDPATYFGDREVDIAMTELFGGFPAAFYQGYKEVFPLDDGYEIRKILYNLYHILNHFNLFGGGYASQANRMIEKILAN